MNTREGDVGRLAVLVALTASIAIALAQALPDRFHVCVFGLGAAWATIQSDVSWRLEQRVAARRLGRFGQRLVELVAMFVVAKALHLMWAGWSVARAEVTGWPTGFVDLETVLAWLVMVSMWTGVSLTLNDLAGLGGRGDPMAEAGLPVPNLIRRWSFGGVVLVVASSVGLAGWSELIDLRRAPLVGLVIPAVVYFPVGVAALSRVRFLDANAIWERERAIVDPEVASRWAVGSLLGAMVVVIGLLVIPAGDTAPVFTVVGGAIGAIGRAIAALVRWLSNRAGDDTTPADTASADGVVPEPFGDPDPVPIQPGETLFPDDVTRLLQRGVFWLLVLIVLVAVVREVYRSRRVLSALVREGFSGHGLIGAMWATLRLIPSVLWGAIVGLLSLLRRRDADHVPESAPSPRSARPGGWEEADPARSRVVTLYRRFIGVTGSHVGSRAPSETPGEYRGRVDDGLPQVAEASASVTALFEEARYSGRPVGVDRIAVTEEQVDEVERTLADGQGADGDPPPSAI
jgi:hypothetical protein